MCAMNGDESTAMDDEDAAAAYLTGALSNLSRSSWAILGLSLLVDTSHVRSFPSYNVVVGLWACYCGNLKCSPSADVVKRDGSEGSGREGERRRMPVRTGLSEELETLLRDASTFSFVASASIIFDVLFCSVWGGEITQGESKSAKFSFTMFIFAMFAKTAAIFYAAQIVVGGSSVTNKGSNERTRGAESTPGAASITHGPEGGNRRVSFDEEHGNRGLSEGGEIYDRHFSNFAGVAKNEGSFSEDNITSSPNERKPSSLLSPGVPGLVSPGATPAMFRNRPAAGPTTPGSQV